MAQIRIYVQVCPCFLVYLIFFQESNEQSVPWFVQYIHRVRHGAMSRCEQKPSIPLHSSSRTRCARASVEWNAMCTDGLSTRIFGFHSPSAVRRHYCSRSSVGWGCCSRSCICTSRYTSHTHSWSNPYYVMYSARYYYACSSAERDGSVLPLERVCRMWRTFIFECIYSLSEEVCVRLSIQFWSFPRCTSHNVAVYRLRVDLSNLNRFLLASFGL